MKSTWVRLALLACCSAPPLLAGCGSLDSLQEAVADVVLPPEQAAELGDRMAREIESKQPLDPRAARQQQVRRIGQRLLAQAGPVPGGPDFSFKVIQQPETVNAFALPGGHVYVTSGMMDLLDGEDELAAVIGHEIAHVTERHIAERMATSYGLQAAASMALGQDPGQLSALVASALQQGFLLKYSRDQELQADRVGVGLMRRAGYDPRAAIEVFRKLAAGGGQRAPAFLSSHPSHAARIEQLQRIIGGG